MSILVVPGPLFPLSSDEVATFVSGGIRQVLTANEAIHQQRLALDSPGFNVASADLWE